MNRFVGDWLEVMELLKEREHHSDLRGQRLPALTRELGPTLRGSWTVLPPPHLICVAPLLRALRAIPKPRRGAFKTHARAPKRLATVLRAVGRIVRIVRIVRYTNDIRRGGFVELGTIVENKHDRNAGYTDPTSSGEPDGSNTCVTSSADSDVGAKSLGHKKVKKRRALKR